MPTISEKSINNLIGLAYESACDTSEGGWREFYSNFAAAISSGGGSLTVFDKADQKFREIANSHSDELSKEINSGYYSLIPWRSDFESLEPGECFDRRRDYPDDEFLSSEIYKALLLRYSIYQFIYFRVHDDKHHSISLGFTWPTKHADVGNDGLAAMETIFPHVRRAMDLHLNQLRTGREKDLMASVISELDEGIALVERDGTMVFVNSAAREILESGSTVCLDAQGRLVAARPSERDLLEEALNVCFENEQALGEGPPFSISLKGQSGEPAIEVIVSKIERENIYSQRQDPLGIVRMRKANPRILHPRTDLVQTFGLTSAEERLALILAEGHSLAESCEILNVTPNTARTHLKRIFSKTDTHRQSSLIKLILAGGHHGS